MKLLQGKIVLVTGAARGIGRAIAIGCADAGADIVFTDISKEENFVSLEKELNSKGIKAKGYVSNAADMNSSAQTVEDILKDFERIDVLVNNAGITRDALLMRMTEEQWDLVINVNLKSVFNLTKAVQKTMLKQRSGSIINVSSVVGVSGNAGQANYSASKAGIIGFTKSIARELGPRNIRCNAIAPGFIETEMTKAIPEDARKEWAEKIPLRRAGQPKDVADLVVFLGSDMSSYISGQVINVCGAMLT
ncbi:MAG: 3-oxoacyl-[acyl-carrier-protein] reductase [Bacteroidales bacterium]|nr:3-oxoacyl-[acyl-carrier-protein] reductase [Bacteroidales bacterium]MDD3859657.1 3-oxoacyl-[acyl-carrier-protein] reductase [Bacteroidales bacterium]